MSETSTDLEGESTEDFRFRIADISPTPDDDVIAAITTALHEVWPRPVVAESKVEPPNVTWRFGQRRWKDRQIPMRTWGRSG